MTELTEAAVTINDTPLSVGQVMSLRVACTDFYNQMCNEPDALGDDMHGRRMVKAYEARLREVLELLVKP